MTCSLLFSQTLPLKPSKEKLLSFFGLSKGKVQHKNLWQSRWLEALGPKTSTRSGGHIDFSTVVVNLKEKETTLRAFLILLHDDSLEKIKTAVLYFRVTKIRRIKSISGFLLWMNKGTQGFPNTFVKSVIDCVLLLFEICHFFLKYSLLIFQIHP